MIQELMFSTFTRKGLYINLLDNTVNQNLNSMSSPIAPQVDSFHWLSYRLQDYFPLETSQQKTPTSPSSKELCMFSRRLHRNPQETSQESESSNHVKCKCMERKLGPLSEQYGLIKSSHKTEGILLTEAEMVLEQSPVVSIQQSKLLAKKQKDWHPWVPSCPQWYHHDGH